MARYSIGQTKSTGAAAGLIAQIRTGTTRDLRVFEIGVFSTTATSCTVGLIRPTAVGSGFTSSPVGAAHDNISGAGVAVVDIAASTAPTIGTNWMRLTTFAAAIGAGMIWTFPDGITVPVSSSLALWQTSAATITYSLYFVYDE